MDKNRSENSSAANTELLTDIRRGVSVLLFLVLFQLMIWPSAWLITRVSDRPLVSVVIIAWSIPLALVFTLMAWRQVFPIQYPNEAK